MKKMRKIIEIDQEKCNGCGQCLLACAEGALELVDGKARVVGDIYCDGLGACLGECPEDALTIVEREAEDFSETAVNQLLQQKEKEKEKQKIIPAQAGLGCGCPGSMARSLSKPSAARSDSQIDEMASELGHWPIKLQLLGPQAPFLKGADLALVADCVGFSYADLHHKILKGHVIAIGCPKLDNLEAHISRLAEILKAAHPASLTVVYMQVPCCKGFLYAAHRAIETSGLELPLKRIMIGIKGELLEEEVVKASSSIPTS